jgi:hypothetical protein
MVALLADLPGHGRSSGVVGPGTGVGAMDKYDYAYGNALTSGTWYFGPKPDLPDSTPIADDRRLFHVT